jgi:NtrC-family two-component system sensor histidine kinase KinB
MEESMTITLKNKILAGYVTSFALMAMVVAWAVINLLSLGKTSNAILRENYRSILAAENMVAELERQDSGILIIFLGDAIKGGTQFTESEDVFFQWLARAKDNITIEGEADLIKSIEADYARYRKQFYELSGLSLNEKHPEGKLPAIYMEMVYPLFKKVRDTCIKLRNLNEDTMYKASIKAGKIADRTIWSTLAVAVSTLIIGLVLCLLMAERIARPLRYLMDASRKIYSGDYTVKIQVKTNDELGRLAIEFNQMADQLKRYNEMNIEQIISEKNKSEAILACIDDGLVVFNTDLEVTGINPAARRIFDLEFKEYRKLHC